MALCLLSCEEPGAPNLQLTAEVLDLRVYAAACKSEMGLDETPLPPMNCLEGVEIPVTVGGARPDAATYEALVAGEIGCDNPSWIGDGEPCANYSFILNKAINDEVSAVLFCRQRSFSSHLDAAERRARYDAAPTRENFEALFNFESLGLILTNTVSGATCFFERVHDTYGGHIMMPDSTGLPTLADLPEPLPPEEIPTYYWEQESRVLWHPPALVANEAKCVACHDSDPFIRSGHIHGLDILPPHAPERPYFMASEIGRIHESRNPPRAISTTPLQGASGAEEQLCTSCHRIGATLGCDRFSRYYTGERAQPGQEMSLPFSARALMPPDDALHRGLGDAAQEAAWRERYQRHVDKLLCCCEAPHALGCILQDLNTSPLPSPVAGIGPMSCEF